MSRVKPQLWGMHQVNQQDKKIRITTHLTSFSHAGTYVVSGSHDVSRKTT
jgi:hypothetical protein